MGLFQVILATAAAQLVGMACYSPPIGSIWVKYTGKSSRDFGKGSMPFVIALVTKLILALLLDNQLRSSIQGGHYSDTAINALFFSIVPALLYANHAAFYGTGWQSVLIDIGYDAVSLIVMALIICHL